MKNIRKIEPDNMIQSFIKSESGAVTVDYIVLTAGIVGLAIAVLDTISNGIADLTTKIDGQLTSIHIFSNFDQSKYSAYYLAIKAHADSLPEGGLPFRQMMRDGDRRFASEVTQANDMSDVTLVAQINGAAPSAAYGRTMITAFDSVDLNTVTVGELATVLGYSEGILQSSIKNNGGSIEAYVAQKRLEYAIDITREDFLKDVADARGLTY